MEGENVLVQVSGSRSMGCKGSKHKSRQDYSNLSKRTFSFHFSSSFNSVI